jgi:hypothetical protein
VLFCVWSLLTVHLSSLVCGVMQAWRRVDLAAGDPATGVPAAPTSQLAPPRNDVNAPGMWDLGYSVNCDDGLMFFF